MADPARRKLLNELIKREGLNNKVCCDCNNPNPQWASLSFAVFLCLQCAGTHRSFGVHISFVRSVSMDSWQDEQLKRMELGGNAPFRDFMKSYDASGGYKDGASPHDTYHCWAATQYREKIDATLAGKPWSPSSPPTNYLSPTNSNTISRSSSPNPSGLRKSRAQNTRSNAGSGINRSSSPASFTSSPPLNNSNTSIPLDQKSQNEAYFTNLGKLNDSRSGDLPPSQGGRYQGFGNTPASTSDPSHPSFSLSSANAPTFSDIQENPMTALSKGWSLFSSAVVGATKTINESVIQPGVERFNDPEFQANVRGYVDGASKKAGELGGAANEWGKRSIGIDVGDAVYGVKERVLGGPERNGYGRVDGYGSGYGGEESPSALYDPNGKDDDDLFGEFTQGQGRSTDGWAGSNSTGDPTPEADSPVARRKGTGVGSVTSRTNAGKKDDGWDDWKDF